jgi:hypothetical protein
VRAKQEGRRPSPPSPKDGIPYPTDITKLVNEIELAKLPYGYALEFYDEDQGHADELIRRIERLSSVESNKLRVVVLECVGGITPMLRFLPKSWDDRIRGQFGKKLDLIECLPCAPTGAPPSTGEGGKMGFLDSPDCSNGARALIEQIEQRFDPLKVKLVFGGKTMTVNRWPSGKLLRIIKESNSVSDLDLAVGRELAERLHLSIRPSYEIKETLEFREAVIGAVSRALESAPIQIAPK